MAVKSVIPNLKNAKNINKMVALFNKENLLKTLLVENRRNISEIDKVVKYPEYMDVKRIWIDDIPAQLLSYKRGLTELHKKNFILPESEDWIVLQLHGGGYINAFKKQYHNMAGFYAEAGRGLQVLSIDYRVAPENPYPAALEDAVKAYKWMLDAAYEPKHIVVAGDSAGGGLSMSLVAYLRDHGMPLPAGIVAMSPWTDVTASGASYDEHYDDDPVFGGTRDSLIYDNPYVGDNDPLNPYISPLFGSFEGFPPMLVQVGEREMLFSDSERVVKKAKEQGVEVKLTVYNEMFHVFQIAGHMMEESKAAWNEISHFLVALEHRNK
ncbi:MAG: alpha/beta hydrolase [Lachnospiraceae bacterium]|nr:alpha/beta hydrolase [Lachnospiraceae bacterium]